ncbi:hypothetical protein KRX51_00770 [Corynebacterium sp. TAE3-ERU12]|uniref:hypothetical protein n=1 Tax=Corynebacterium sp. TAE3-ERU12 TaxID=2849491 RepID=UPI001C4910AF|nr:hypothetical protein [Corynebacterium sp. TAE3-ERU12]MBV7294451.1 hypothetical protein [Corynebacterium sp. TAE3-ERU12]
MLLIDTGRVETHKFRGFRKDFREKPKDSSNYFYCPLVALVSGIASQLAFLIGNWSWRGEYYTTAQWIEGNAIPAAVLTSVAIAIDGWFRFGPRSKSVLVAGKLWNRYVIRYSAFLIAGFSLPLFGAFIFGATFWPHYANEMVATVLLHFLVAWFWYVALLLLAVTLSAYFPVLGWSSRH